VGTFRYACIVVALLGSRALGETDIQQADKLFAEGVALRETNLEQSCKKFRESLDLNPQAIGTLMNVALCDEKLGHIASAYERFSEARDRAKEGNLPEYLAEAQSRIDALRPELPHLHMTFATKLEGMRVLIGDRVISTAKLESGEGAAVDPGELVIVVSAPGRLAYETKLVIKKQEHKTVAIPELQKGVTVKSSRRTIGIITTISGGAALASGIVLGLVARNTYNDQFFEGGCQKANGGDVCPPEQQTETERARTIGNVGTVVGAVGLVATGVGVYLWLSAPKESGDQRVSIVPTLTPDTAGVTAIGRF